MFKRTIFRHPDTLSATIVRNILSKVRSYADRYADYVQVFDFRYGRYEVTAYCRWSCCTKLDVRLNHRDSSELWVIEPVEYSLLSYDAFEL